VGGDSKKTPKLAGWPSRHQRAKRFILAGAVEADVDGAGRILVPDFLKDFGRFALARDIGRSRRPYRDLERKNLGRVQAPGLKRRDQMAEKLGDLGFL